MEVTVSRSETYARKIFLMKLPLLTQCDADESCTYLDDGSQALGAACVVLGVHYPTVPDERIAQSSPGAGRWKVSLVWCLQFACLCSETSFRLNQWYSHGNSDGSDQQETLRIVQRPDGRFVRF